MKLVLMPSGKNNTLNQTYMVSIGDDFSNMPFSNETSTYFENATIVSKDGWFVVEGDSLNSTIINSFYDDEIFDKEGLKKYRDPYNTFHPVPSTYETISYAHYTTTGRVFLKETTPLKITFRHAIFKEFLEL